MMSRRKGIFRPPHPICHKKFLIMEISQNSNPKCWTSLINSPQRGFPLGDKIQLILKLALPKYFYICDALHLVCYSAVHLWRSNIQYPVDGLYLMDINEYCKRPYNAGYESFLQLGGMSWLFPQWKFSSIY